jgi:thermostable 8-oxoguanine DNA glycosylase
MVLRKAKVRMPAQKAAWLAANFASIEKAGGVKAVTRKALGLATREQKYRFMDAFEGIGPKYARNVWMDIYDPLFRNAVAIDERIKSITGALGYSFRTYDEHENFYREIAREVQLEPWEVDRLLYQFRDDFLAAIRKAA